MLTLTDISVLDLTVAIDLHLPDAEATALLGQRIAPYLRVGDVVYLEGPLGAGKSSLARGLIRALTTPDQDVPSPTFTLIQTYETGHFTLAHLDLYRLQSPEETWELGLDDLQSTGVLLIEWPQRLGYLGFDDRLDISLQHTDTTHPLPGQHLPGRTARLAPQGHFRTRTD